MSLITRDDLLAQMHGQQLKHGEIPPMMALQSYIVNFIAKNVMPETPNDPTPIQKTKFIMNALGPAASSAAVDYALVTLKQAGRLSPKLVFNGNYVNDMKVMENDAGCGDFTSILQQYLLPRAAYIDFDSMVDPKHRVDQECGYPKYITPMMYRYMYDRDDIARRVCDVYSNESWAVDPRVYETDDENQGIPDTPFEEDWEYQCTEHNLLSTLYRFDKLCGIGHFGALLIGVNDGKGLDEPIDEPELVAGKRHTTGKKTREVLYYRPFDEYLSYVTEYERDTSSPRCGLPLYYNLTFVDTTTSSAGSSIGTRTSYRVHWTRVVHTADNLVTGGMVYGTPRQQPVFNRELDLRKLKGGGAEMFWKGAFPGIAFEVDPKFIADNPTFDKDEAKEQTRNYFRGLDRSLFLMGISAKTLAPMIATDPEKYTNIQLTAIASSLEMPLRVFLGSEEGRLASGQDMQTWNNRLGRRCRLFVAPMVIRATIERLVAIGAMRPPAKRNKYFVEWPDLNAPTSEDKANLSLKWTQALSQYVASGMIHLIQPMDYMTTILGLRPSQAKRINDAITTNGGWDKLRGVDPAQGSGENGKASNISSGAGGKKKAKQRNTSDKKPEGMSS